MWPVVLCTVGLLVVQIACNYLLTFTAITIHRLLQQFKKETQPQLRPSRELPPSLLEVDWHNEIEFADYKLPAEVMYMLRSVRYRVSSAHHCIVFACPVIKILTKH